MSNGTVVISGVVKDAVIVPEGNVRLPDGVRVEIVIPKPRLPSALARELAEWDRASDEVWAMIDQWEDEDNGAAR